MNTNTPRGGPRARPKGPAQVPAISCAYAQQLEFKGEYDPALRAFESAKKAIDRAYQRRVEEKEEDLEGDMMRKKCLCGVARCLGQWSSSGEATFWR